MENSSESAVREKRLLDLVLSHEAAAPQRRPTALFMARLHARLDKTAVKKTLWPRYATAAAAILLVLSAGFYLFREGDIRVVAVSGNVRIDGKAATGDQKVRASSTVETAPESYAILHFGNAARLILEGETRLTIVRATAGKVARIELRLESGSAFSDVKHGQANYIISAGGQEFHVLGTAFSVESYQNGQSRLRVLRGVVATASAQLPEKIGADEQLPCHARLCAAREKISTAQKAWLQLLLAATNGAGLLRLAEAEMRRPFTPSEIGEKYGKISMVETRDGKRYTGGFRTQNEYLMIQTPTGKFKIHSGQVSKVIPLGVPR